MAIPFARSERSLQTDDYRTALLCSLVAVPVFALWMVWFFASDLPIYETSEQLTIGEQNTLVANFALEDAPDLDRGDEVRLQVQLSGNAAPTLLSATVTAIRQRDDGSFDVEVYPSAEDLDGVPLSKIRGYVELDIDDRSPFEVLLQGDEE